jgi:hypothetical protein
MHVKIAGVCLELETIWYLIEMPTVSINNLGKDYITYLSITKQNQNYYPSTAKYEQSNPK